MEAKPTIGYRKLRIAWSVGWGILCLLLIALWVRSYWHIDAVFGKAADGIFVLVQTYPGGCGVSIYPEEYVAPGMYKQPTKDWLKRKDASWHGLLTFYVSKEAVVAPYWFWLPMPALLAATPYFTPLGKRFSLRALLIAMTVVAVSLGVIVWAVR